VDHTLQTSQMMCFKQLLKSSSLHGIRLNTQWRWSCGGPDPLTFWQWGSKCACTPTFSAMLLYMACNPWYQFCRQWMNSACTRISVVTHIKHQCGLYKAVWLYELHLNVSQRVSWLCPDPLESPWEGREERRIDGGREVAWTGTPKINDNH